jgi:hypothetical protein
MLEFSVNTVAPESTIKSNSGSFLDPTVGFYCQMLATKNITRNAVGEQNSAVLLRWATLMTVTALKRCGIPVSLFYILHNYLIFYIVLFKMSKLNIQSYLAKSKLFCLNFQLCVECVLRCVYLGLVDMKLYIFPLCSSYARNMCSTFKSFIFRCGFHFYF